MKKLYILSLSLLSIASVNSQVVVFTSNLSSWSSAVPTDFMGSKTNIAASNVVEITTGAQFGTSLAQLTETTIDHKRFTTQPIPVTAGQGYELKVWAKGQGDMRFGLYDANSGMSAGFISYSAYQAVSGTTSTMYSATIGATNTTTVGEFVISVRNTVAPDHIQIDSVSITEVVFVPPTAISVYDIQFSTATPADSPYTGQIVNTGGIVTHVRSSDNKGFYISSGTGPWSGVYVYSTLNPSPVAVGDSVTFSATVVEFNGLTELSFPNDLVIVSSGNFFMPTPVETVNALTEAYEGCFISACGICSASDDTFGDWTLDDGSGDAEIGDFFSTNMGVQGNYYNTKGIIDYAFGYFGWLPRNAGDVQQVTSCTNSIEDNNKNMFAVYPNEVTSVLTIANANGFDAKIISVEGKEMSSIAITSNAYEVNVATYPAGVYFFQVNGQAIKFVKN